MQSQTYSQGQTGSRSNSWSGWPSKSISWPLQHSFSEVEEKKEGFLQAQINPETVVWIARGCKRSGLVYSESEAALRKGAFVGTFSPLSSISQEPDYPHWCISRTAHWSDVKTCPVGCHLNPNQLITEHFEEFDCLCNSPNQGSVCKSRWHKVNFLADENELKINVKKFCLACRS